MGSDGIAGTSGAAGTDSTMGSNVECGGSSSSSSSSLLHSLAEAVGYVQASVAAGMSKVVLSIPDEAPPLDRDLQERWLPGWEAPHPASSSAGGGGYSAAAAAGAGGGSCADDGRVEQGAAALVGFAAESQQRAVLAALVCAGRGSGRAVASEQDICQLLGVPFREPSERCC
jgi:hypothetical protein